MITIVKMWIFTIFIFFFIFLNAQNKNECCFKDLIEEFKDIKTIKNNYRDSVILGQFDNIIDTNIIKKYKLLNNLIEGEFKLKNIEEYHCSAIGKIDICPNIIMLIYEVFTTEAGFGSPCAVFRILNDSLKMLDQIFVWYFPNYGFEGKNISFKYDKNKLIIEEIHIEREILNGVFVDKRISKEINEYVITKEYKILHKNKETIILLRKVNFNINEIENH